MAKAIAGIEIVGAKEVERAFTILPDRLARKAVVVAVRDAQKPIIKDARSRIARHAVRGESGRMKRVRGQLAKSIGSRVKFYKNTGTVLAIIGPRRKYAGMIEGIKPTRYAHLVEFGTRRSRAKPFLRPALSAQAGAAKAAFAKRFRKELDKEITKIRKRGRRG